MNPNNFSKLSRQSISKQQLYQSNRLSHDSQYYTEGGSKNASYDLSLQSYLPPNMTNSSHELLRQTTHFGEDKNKKTIKTIRLKTHLKSQINENNTPLKLSKSKIRLNTQNNYQAYEKPFTKFRATQNTCHTPSQSSNTKINLKNSKINKPLLSNSTKTPIRNPLSNSSSYNTTCRQSQIYSLSPIKDKIKLQVKLKKVQSLYQSSIKNYKQILIKLQIEVEKNKLNQKQIQRIREEKQVVQTIVKQKQTIIKTKQKNILDNIKQLKQKQIIINNKNQQFSSIISQYEYRITQYQKSIVKYEQQLLKTKNELYSLNLKVQPWNTKLISCLDEIEYLKNQKQELVKGHIQQLYYKNKQILKLNQLIDSNNKSQQQPVIGTSFSTFGKNNNKNKNKVFKSNNNNNNKYNSKQQYHQDLFKLQNELNNKSDSQQKNQSYQDFDQKLSMEIDCKDGIKINQNTNYQYKNMFNLNRRNSLMDMKQVMSIDGIDDTQRSKIL